MSKPIGRTYGHKYIDNAEYKNRIHKQKAGVGGTSVWNMRQGFWGSMTFPASCVRLTTTDTTGHRLDG